MNLCFSIFKRIFSGSALFEQRTAAKIEQMKRIVLHKVFGTSWCLFSFSGERNGFQVKDEEIKKGAGYLEELAGRLRRVRIHTLPVQDGLLTVTLEDPPVGA